MNKIITISREFGSGGREVAKRLAEFLGFKYYDKAIIDEMLKQSKFDEKYIEGIEKISNDDFPYIISRSFSLYSAHQKQATEVLVLEQKIIKQLAQQGDCVFVGRCADVILRDLKPLNVFVYADDDFKLKRCREKAPKDEKLTDRQLMREIKRIDKARKRHSLLLGSGDWGEKEKYHLCLNTSDFAFKEIIPALAECVKVYFKEKK